MSRDGGDDRGHRHARFWRAAGCRAMPAILDFHATIFLNSPVSRELPIALASKFLFVICAVACAAGLISPPFALALGLGLGLFMVHPWPEASRKVQRMLLQASVVALGFGMDLHQIIRAGKLGFLYTAIGIAGALVLGQVLGRLLRVQATSSYLISTGTAICGGSAIAAVAPITQATEEQIAVSLSTVFVLNSIALWLFPPIGALFHLSQSQFGLWSALAIHDTSSVVGAAARYGAVALAVGTTVKLARALWIVPVSLGTAMVKKSQTKIQLPWFIAFFCIAAMLNTYLPAGSGAFSGVYRLGRFGLTLTLFLIGAGVSRQTLKAVGVRPLLQGVILWMVVASITLLLVYRNVIHL
jgi:uncharacterized integral membrane protein (TIGR00698 family)